MRKVGYSMVFWAIGCSAPTDGPRDFDAAATNQARGEPVTQAGASLRDGGQLDAAGFAAAGEAGDALAPEAAADSGAVPCTKLQSAPDGGGTLSEFGLEGMTLRTGFRAAKDACDERLGWECGEFRLFFNEQGCLWRFELDRSPLDIAPEYAACMVSEMARWCDPCAAEVVRLDYESCTIL